MGIGLAALAGGLGDILGGAINSLYHWEQNNWKSDYDVTQELRDYDKSVSDYFLDKQMAYNKEMSSTAYQRAVADMQAAGINPASMAGVNAQAASTPSINAGSHTGSAYNSAAHNYMNSFLTGSLVHSAMNAAIAKDNKVADLMASEIVDNARHAYHMEESKEQRDMYNSYSRLAKAKARYQELENVNQVLRDR